MYRRGAIISLVVGAALIFSLAFTSFPKQLDAWEYDDEGNPERVSIQCDTPWNLVVGDTYLDTDPAWHGTTCLPSARVLMTEAVIVALVVLGLGWKGFISGPRPPTKPIDTLPQLERLDA